jgi:hypothetical protein
MIKVEKIEESYFDLLAEKPITNYEFRVVRDCKKSQKRYSRLTLKKYILFWLIFNKHFDITLSIQKDIFNTYGELYPEKEDPEDVKRIEITDELEQEYIKKYFGD